MPADLSPVRPGNAERLSRMVQLATTADDGDEPFAALEALLAAEYPRAHARLALEKVTDRSLLYLWKGASSDRPIAAGQPVSVDRRDVCRRALLGGLLHEYHAPPRDRIGAFDTHGLVALACNAS